MSTATSPAVAMLRTEGRLMLREPGAMFWIVFFPTILLCVLGAIPSFREVSDDLGGVRVIDLYVPIVVLLSAIMASLQSMPAVISGYRENLVLRRYATTPARPTQILMAQWVIHGAGILAGSILAVTVGRLVFDVSLPGSPIAYLGIFVLAVLANLSTGGLISGLAPSTKASAAIGTVVFFPTMFTAGVWVPVTVLPGLLGDVIALTPNGAAALALDEAAAGRMPDMLHVLVLLAWTVGLGALAARYFRWE
ncbi:ABC transporter permease [Mumia zhuanghuii]|uniref:Transport permease protein n=2 Tax=Mumia TaxID=1546255 RepID=A0ABW1QJP2_9ACTN|nr:MULTISPECIES: ABC transporter permease [Mumia]KAA1419806.1 ABC transporter permease [Mumia zhuanghuii]